MKVTRYMHAVRNLNRIDNATLGLALKQYIQDANHNNWDAFNDTERHGAQVLIEDLWGNIEDGLLGQE